MGFIGFYIVFIWFLYMVFICGFYIGFIWVIYRVYMGFIGVLHLYSAKYTNPVVEK
jgi:hypothetical protein